MLGRLCCAFYISSYLIIMPTLEGGCLLLSFAEHRNEA